MQLHRPKKILLTLGATLILGSSLAQAAKYPIPAAVSEADFFDHGPLETEKIALGKLLFWDKLLSGNKNISCASCHHAMAWTSDGLSLPIGEGGKGIGITRKPGTGSEAVPERVPRNAPMFFNLGAREFTKMFHDGRVAEDPEQPSGFLNPAGTQLPPGLDNVLAAQAMFPVTSSTEMAGQAGENSIADAAAADQLGGTGGVWDQLAERLRNNPEYVGLFKDAFPDIETAEDISFVHAANAIAAFEDVVFRAYDSPFDRFLNGQKRYLTKSALKGKKLFYNKAGCAQCHSGSFQTDHQFHAIAMPQIGPGKGDGLNGHDDFGRERVTANPADRYKFRTPSLRNIALTGPWGHDGAYNSLRAVIEHHLDPVKSLESYDPNQVVLPSRPDLDAQDFVVYNDENSRNALIAANEKESLQLSDLEIDQLLSFLHALTDTSSLDLRGTVPMRVPSGLPIAD